MTTKEIIAALEAAARAGAHIACFDLRKRGIMPFRVRVQLWCDDPDNPGLYKNTEFESLVDATTYEKLYQEWLVAFAAAAAPDSNPLDKKEVIDDVFDFIKRERDAKESDDQGPDEETPTGNTG